ncbi:MAG: EamA/RhaT family transporter [Candidatus Eisenbacteria bacterium]|uniref:EamA/RhaT family transporter n=1 Tax=Eiseniibacteriota bacterium TaxID=2212470 RepID=A0A538U677_UNCEI|nr:MAG: EamA/RhaT family transporter [Candidatus Eisenbacteria bacterium]
MGVLLGALAATFWGLGDFLITLLTRRVGTGRALLSIQLLSLLLWLALLAARPGVQGAGALPWTIVVATALCHVLGLALVYRAFEIGTLSIVSPISAGFAVVTAILSLASGERPPALALGGAALLVGGAVLATRAPAASGPRASWAGVPEALLSALAFGTMFWLFYFFVQPAMGFRWPLVLLKAAAVTGSVLAYLSKPRGPRAAAPGLRIQVVGLALGAAAADTLAWLAYIGGTATSYATIVTALASLFSVVTVLLARRFLRERLAPHQWSGVVAILLGILLVSV